ncbi:MAG: DUF86 domain-containing protein [Oscillatoriales cyanobacterium SM2_2_1]|nr:DUF86 domain-containing protein [Oscillatoriales cyanobacterium SM2_2_1]
MNTTKKLETQVQELLEVMDAATGFIADMTFANFCSDQRTIFALERALGLVGATAKRLPLDFIDRHPHVDWRHLINVGDNLTFGYLEVDLQTLWDITINDLPPLRSQMDEAMAALASL